MTRVIVHIERLVLTGFRREDRHAVAAGLQHELSRMFAAPQAAQALSALGNVSRLQAGGVRISNGSKPQRIGENVARSIVREMTT